MGQTVVEKIAQSHMAEGPTDRPLRAGDPHSQRLLPRPLAFGVWGVRTWGPPSAGEPTKGDGVDAWAEWLSARIDAVKNAQV